MEIIDSWGEAFRSIFGGVFDWLKQKALDILPVEFLGFDIQPVLVSIGEGFKAAFATVTNLVSGLFDGMVKIFSGIGDILSS